jgi:hypothetical protein
MQLTYWVLLAVYVIGSNIVADYCLKRNFGKMRSFIVGTSWGLVSLTFMSVGSILRGGSVSNVLDTPFLPAIVSLGVMALPGFLSLLKRELAE